MLPAGRRALLPRGGGPGSLPWIITAAAFLAVLAVAAAIGLAHWAGRLDAAGSGRFTIEIVDPDPARLEIAVARLVRQVGREVPIAHVARVPRQEIAALLAPTLGRALDDLPLPALVELTLERGASEGPLRAIVARNPPARLLSAADELAPLAALVATLRRLAWAIVALGGIVTVLMAMLAAHMALERHGPTLATLHALGATDRDLASLVQRRTAIDTLAGGAAGLAGGLVAIMLVERRLAALDEGVAAGLPGAGSWLLLALVPVVLAGAATLATRLAVLAALARRP